MDFLTSLLNGLSQGAVYALIALGYTMVYGIAKLLNFAHGDIIMVGAYTIVVSVGASIHPIAGLILAIIFCVILGVLIEKLAYRPLRGSSPLAVLITAIGVSYLIQSIAFLIFGSSPRITSLTKLNDLEVALLTLGCSVILCIVLMLFIKLTKVGKAMLAVSEDRNTASLMGINHNFIITITFVIGSALAGVAGYFYLLKNPVVTYQMGSVPGIKAFSAAVIGGIGSLPGAMLGGIIMGIIEALCSYLNKFIQGFDKYTLAIEFGILIVVLLFKPYGILGKQRREKV